MSQVEMLTDFGPLAIMAAALVWGFGRILYLKLVQNVAVLSLLSARKTRAEYGLGIIAFLSNIYILLRPFLPVLDRWVERQISPAPYLALGVMAFSIVLMIFCQIGMGKSWRIGVPQAAEEGQSLVAHGPYKHSRNPIYVAILLYLAGIVLLLPGPFTLAVLLGTFLLLRPVIRREEAFMEATYGEEYRQYKQRVRRWI